MSNVAGTNMMQATVQLALRELTQKQEPNTANIKLPSQDCFEVIVLSLIDFFFATR